MTRNRSLILLLLLSLGSVVACENTSPVTDPSAANGLGLAPPTGDNHSRGNLVWDDSVNMGTGAAPVWLPAGIRGDGRDRIGQLGALRNEYQGNYCGVRAIIYDGRNENGYLNVGLDVYYDEATMAAACGAARYMVFYLGTATQTGSTGSNSRAGFNVAVWDLAVGVTRLQSQTIGTSFCHVVFDPTYPGSSSIRVTRLDDIDGARQWRMESQGNHVAACLLQNPKTKKWVDSGIRYYLPFAATISQVAYPYPNYP